MNRNGMAGRRGLSPSSHAPPLHRRLLGLQHLSGMTQLLLDSWHREKWACGLPEIPSCGVHEEKNSRNGLHEMVESTSEIVPSCTRALSPSHAVSVGCSVDLSLRHVQALSRLHFSPVSTLKYRTVVGQLLPLMGRCIPISYLKSLIRCSCLLLSYMIKFTYSDYQQRKQQVMFIVKIHYLYILCVC